MTAVEEIFAEAQEIAAEANAQVIRNALIDYPARCGSCEFPEHFNLWLGLLAQYTELRCRLHRLSKVLDSEWYDYVRQGSMRNTQLNMEKVYEECISIRKQMMACEPCLACRHRYNPTGRARLPHRNAPTKGKDFFDG